MKLNSIWNDKKIIEILKNAGIVVMPTDTIYGIVGKALNFSVVNRIYELRKRASNKPCIILIGDVGELEKFSTVLSEEQKNKIKEFKGPVSFILDCLNDSFTYLHRGTNSLAFRLPQEKSLRDFLLKTGPLVAPSANLEGLSPAQNILEAKKYFGDAVDLYIDGGEIKGNPSKVIKLYKDGSVDVLR